LGQSHGVSFNKIQLQFIITSLLQFMKGKEGDKNQAFIYPKINRINSFFIIWQIQLYFSFAKSIVNIIIIFIPIHLSESGFPFSIVSIYSERVRIIIISLEIYLGTVNILVQLSESRTDFNRFKITPKSNSHK
jgi:hypothetical protein